MKRYLILVICALLSIEAFAQWGGTFLEGQNVDDSRRTNFGSTSQPHPSAEMNGNADPLGGDDEFKDQWMPTGRTGFQIPQKVKDMIDKGKSSRTSASSFRSKSRDGFTGGNMMGNANDDDADEDDSDDASENIPKKSPGRDESHRRIDQCLRKVSHFCSTRVMNENFAMFNDCVFEMRFRLSQDCQTWAEGHGACAADMVKHCPSMSPADTTECLRSKKQSLSLGCVDSSFYKSMEEGFQDFRSGMEQGVKGNPQGPRRYSGPPPNNDEEGSAPSREDAERRQAQQDPIVRRRTPRVHEAQDEFATDL